jgi:acetyl esterase/lipase
MDVLRRPEVHPDTVARAEHVRRRLAEIPRPTTPQEARAFRLEGRSVYPHHPPVPDRVTTHSVDGPGGPIELRCLVPENPVGVHLHFHGGGWVLGRPHLKDASYVALADATGLAVVSPYYRLAPEDPWPAATDDAAAVAEALVDNAVDWFGAPVATIGGESAGAHLAVSALLAIRDDRGAVPFAAASLFYGAFDLSGTPSLRRFGERPVTLNGPGMQWVIDLFVPDGVDRRDPRVSPLYADLSDMPPALFVVGTDDPLLDDTLFMAARWEAAGGEVSLVVEPGAQHAFDYWTDDVPAAEALRTMYAFLRDRTPAGSQGR